MCVHTYVLCHCMIHMCVYLCYLIVFIGMYVCKSSGESVFEIKYTNLIGRTESITHAVTVNSSIEALYFRYAFCTHHQICNRPVRCSYEQVYVCVYTVTVYISVIIHLVSSFSMIMLSIRKPFLYLSSLHHYIWWWSIHAYIHI